VRILVDLQTLHTPERQRGIGIAVRGLAQALLRQSPEHQFFLGRKPGVDWEFAGVPAQETDLSRIWDTPSHWTVADPEKYLNRSGINMIYVTSPLMFDVAWLPTPAGVRVACQVHDLIPLVMPEQYLKRWPADLQADYGNRLRLVAGADLLLCDSQATASDVQSHLQPRGKVAVTYLSSTHPFKPMDQDVARKVIAQRLGVRDPYVLAVSGWDYRKNNPGILAGFATAALSRHRLVLVGFHNPDHVRGLQSLAQRHGIADRIIQPPFVPVEVLNSLYCGADLMLFPSLYEGFGLPVLESLLCGVPVVTGNNSSLPETLGAGGILVDPADPEAIGAAVRCIALDRNLRALLSVKGVQHAAQFTWEAVAARVRSAFSGVTG